MELTTRLLSSFIGGQVEIKTKTHHKRGPAKQIEATENHLHIVYEWLATTPADGQVRQEWTLTNQTVIDLDYAVINIVDLGDRILLVCSSEEAQYIVFRSPSHTPELTLDKMKGML